MHLSDYLLDQPPHDWPTMLAPWHSMLPEEFTLWMVNRFGDLFIILDDGRVDMVDIGAASRQTLAASRDEFSDKLDEGENANVWLMIPLVDACVAAWMALRPGQCYSFKIPPLLREGEYKLENVAILNVEAHYSFYGHIYNETKDLPEGAKVRLKELEQDMLSAASQQHPKPVGQ